MDVICTHTCTQYAFQQPHSSPHTAPVPHVYCNMNITLMQTKESGARNNNIIYQLTRRPVAVKLQGEKKRDALEFYNRSSALRLTDPVV